MSKSARIKGKVEYREGEGVSIVIRLTPACSAATDALEAPLQKARRSAKHR